MSIQTNTISPEQEALLFACLQEFRPMVCNLIRGTDTDIEDAIQEVALVLLQEIPKLSPGVHNPIGYMNVIVRRYFWRERNRPTLARVSLDAPLYVESKTTLADTLPAPEQSPASVPDPVLYRAMHRLPREEQNYLRDRYGIRGFTSWSRRGRKIARDRTHQSLVVAAFYHLRKDQQLQQATTPIGPA